YVPMKSVIQNIVSFSLRHTTIVYFLTALLVIVGVICLRNTPIEAFPDVTNTRARIITQWPGRSAEEIEKFVTLPIIKEMKTITSQSIPSTETASSPNGREGATKRSRNS